MIIALPLGILGCDNFSSFFFLIVKKYVIRLQGYKGKHMKLTHDTYILKKVILYFNYTRI
jgi:hypothetical protein